MTNKAQKFIFAIAVMSLPCTNVTQAGTTIRMQGENL